MMSDAVETMVEPMAEAEHGAHSMDMDHMMMKMYFHGGYEEVILFDFWRISTIGGLIGSMVGCFLLGVLYEGVKFYRESWMRGSFQTVKYNQVDNVVQGDKDPNVTAAENGTGDAQSDQVSTTIKMVETRMFSRAHIVLTLLHLIQVTLAYFLMLIFMTYNSWLCAATVVGATAGYFLFGWRKTVVVDVTDHCH